MPADHTIYAIVEPVRCQIVYVGRTTGLPERWRQHCSDLALGQHANRDLQLVYERVPLGSGLQLTVLDGTDDPEMATHLEREWIRTGLARGWPLTNWKETRDDR